MAVQGKIYVLLSLASYIAITVHCYTLSLTHEDNNDDLFSIKDIMKRSNIWHTSTSFIENDVFLINTPGCYIPNYTKRIKFNRSNSHNLFVNACGARAIFVETVANNKIYFWIDKQTMKKYTVRKKYRCCYKFAYKAIAERTENGTSLIFTKCRTLKTGMIVPLDHEIIVVSCTPPKQKHKEIYNDAYIKLKKLNVSGGVFNKTSKPSWNVLMLGLHSMSRVRLLETMPHISEYLRRHNWLDYRGFQKIGSSTFPNLVTLLTGKNYTTIVAECDSGLYKCAEYFIWNKFMEAGYVSAYGEDYLDLPDTFSNFGGFKIRPTHHYMRPFYRLRERRLRNILCLRRQPSVTHLLNYSLEFAQSYKDKRFFGMFWINSYSHDVTDDPSMVDRELAEWFLKLNSTGVLKNTFVIFFSDHGTKFGDLKLPIESYYEERLPMLFIWVPHKFKKKYTQKYTNMLVNQHRLITPYDLYVTLGDILTLTNSSVKPTISEACPRCLGLFNLKSIRWTCANARVSENGCSCRTMITFENNSTETRLSLALAVEFINNVTDSVTTTSCMTCKPLTLKTIFRSHAFQTKDRIYNIVAFEMSSNVRFEATIVYRDDKSRVLYLHTITAYYKNSNCVSDPSDRPYCDCDQTECEDNELNTTKALNENLIH